jgi:hypothetical protein
MPWVQVPLLAALALGLAPGRAHAGEAWEHVTREEGITVTRHLAPGRTFPTFRAVGVVETAVWDVLAVLSDIGRYSEWQIGCAARQLKQDNEFERTAYVRLKAPWPVQDRDAVYRSTVVVALKPHPVVDVRFTAVKHPQAPPVKGVVRMETVRGHFKLTVLGPTRTMMDYQVDADPGGLIPSWLARRTTRRVPLDMIRSMRKRVKVTRGWYDARIKTWQEIAKTLPQ